MGKQQRSKGQRGEREAAKALQALWPDAKRGLGQARSGGDVPDVDGTPFWCEVKRRQSIAALRYLEQADAATDGRPPLVLMREDTAPGQRVRWVAMLDLGALLDALTTTNAKEE